MAKRIIKQIVIAVLTVVVPFIYSALVDIAPGIPIGQDQFLQLIIWLISGIIGGGAIAMASDTFMAEQPATLRSAYYKTLAFIVPAVVYAFVFLTAAKFVL